VEKFIFDTGNCQEISESVINLDVVTRYYVFVTCHHTIILMTPHVTRHFTIQVGTIIVRKHSETV